MSYDSTQDTREHIRRVCDRLFEIMENLTRRGQIHDRSKLEAPEKAMYDEWKPKLRTMPEGSPEIIAARAAMGEALQHHYANNPHHPESTRTQYEEWRTVEGFDGYYEISNFGDVRSIDRIVPRDGPTGVLTRKGQPITPHITPKGYLRCQLTINAKASNKMIHRLVAEAFIPNPENRPEVNHRNGNKKDNHVANLEWATQSENQTHAYAVGLKKAVVKYVVTCLELDITTFGTEKMQNELRARGYEKAESAAIWNCITGNNRSHLGLTFTSVNIEDYKPESDIRFMSLLDIIEMLCDWQAAIDEKGGVLLSDVQRQRFHISDQCYRILENTVRELGW